MGSLYVVAAPAGDPNDLTHRALRILETVPLVVADDQRSAQAVLDHHGIATIASPLSRDGYLDVLAEGDVAYLLPGLSPAICDAGYRLVRRALDGGYPVVPVPGASFPITALVLSGLPADSFVYLGVLPQDPVARGELIAAVSLEPRTVLALIPRAILPAALADLRSTLGDRPLVLVAPSTTGAQVVWRGRLEQHDAASDQVAVPDVLALVMGGAPVGAGRWDEGRLHSAIQGLLVEGMGAKEISQRLSAASGWPRREIYRLAVELAQGGATNAV